MQTDKVSLSEGQPAPQNTRAYQRQSPYQNPNRVPLGEGYHPPPIDPYIGAHQQLRTQRNNTPLPLKYQQPNPIKDNLTELIEDIHKALNTS